MEMPNRPLRSMILFSKIPRRTRQHKNKAHAQLGTSGSGNHFVEFGSLTLEQPLRLTELGPDVYFVNGTPTDCVHLALTGEPGWFDTRVAFVSEDDLWVVDRAGGHLLPPLQAQGQGEARLAGRRSPAANRARCGQPGHQQPRADPHPDRQAHRLGQRCRPDRGTGSDGHHTGGQRG